METYIAFLRGINVGGRNMIPMAELRQAAADLGMRSAKTLLHSGNMVFQDHRTEADLLALLQEETSRRFGVTIPYMLRTRNEILSVVERNPFPEAAENDPGHLLVHFLSEIPGKGAEAELQRAIKGREVARVIGREAYIVFPDGAGASKLTPNIIEKALGARATARNWNTVLKLCLIATEIAAEAGAL